MKVYLGQRELVGARGVFDIVQITILLGLNMKIPSTFILLGHWHSVICSIHAQ